MEQIDRMPIPAPWRTAGVDPKNLDIIVKAENNAVIAYVRGSQQDAQLIASAPYLLVALEIISDEMETSHDSLCDSHKLKEKQDKRRKFGQYQACDCHITIAHEALEHVRGKEVTS